MGQEDDSQNMVNLNQALDSMGGTLVLLFTVPIVAAVVAEIATNTDVDPTTKRIVGFVGTIYSLGVLLFAVRGFLGNNK